MPTVGLETTAHHLDQPEDEEQRHQRRNPHDPGAREWSILSHQRRPQTQLELFSQEGGPPGPAEMANPRCWIEPDTMALRPELQTERHVLGCTVVVEPAGGQKHGPRKREVGRGPERACFRQPTGQHVRELQEPVGRGHRAPGKTVGNAPGQGHRPAVGFARSRTVVVHQAGQPVRFRHAVRVGEGQDLTSRVAHTDIASRSRMRAGVEAHHAHARKLAPDPLHGAVSRAGHHEHFVRYIDLLAGHRTQAAPDHPARVERRDDHRYPDRAAVGAHPDRRLDVRCRTLAGTHTHFISILRESYRDS